MQQNFKDTLLDPANQKKDFANLFAENGITVKDRMAVYRGHVLDGLCDVIGNSFPLIARLTGDDFLKAAAFSYVKNNLPQKGNLNLYGATFPAFLEQYEPARCLPYLPDIARMEWAKNEAYYARDDAPLDPASLQKIPQNELQHIHLHFRDSVRFIESRYPLITIRDFCSNDNSDDTILDIDTGPSHLMIFRPQLRSFILEVDPFEYLFLQQIAKNKTLGQAATTVTALAPDFPLENILHKHFGLGSFSGFTKPAQP
ncbi:MAG: putative DNA-binding domain-containing protein [Rhodospirillales bacterium]|nr:putative DNA-binding domain-containing protein [Rhodospirillales bacterium]